MIEIIKLSGGKIISTNDGTVSISANSNKIVQRTDTGEVLAEINSNGETNYDANGVAYRRNGLAPDGTRTGDWKAKPNVDVLGVI